MVLDLKRAPSGQTIVKPTALGPVANTDTKLLIYGLFQSGRVLAQDGNRLSMTVIISCWPERRFSSRIRRSRPVVNVRAITDPSETLSSPKKREHIVRKAVRTRVVAGLEFGAPVSSVPADTRRHRRPVVVWRRKLWVWSPILRASAREALSPSALPVSSDVPLRDTARGRGTRGNSGADPGRGRHGGRIDRATARAHRDVHPFPETGASLARRVAPDGVVAPLLAESEICLWWWSGYV